MLVVTITMRDILLKRSALSAVASSGKTFGGDACSGGEASGCESGSGDGDPDGRDAGGGAGSS